MKIFRSIVTRLQRGIANYKCTSKRQYYFLYSIIFIIAILLVYGCYFVNGKSFIWQNDGWNQHYRALVYYAKWLRSIVRTLLFEHRLEIPTYSFSIGYGSDIITSLHYYVIGDPLCLLSVFVPTKYMAYFYSGMIVFRLYLAGITFSSFSFYMREKNIKETEEGFGNIAVLAGTLVYMFCGFAIYAGIRHPYFLNPMIYLPLVLLGVERILDKKKPYVFILSVFVSAISNFYFFYMIAILTVLYVIWRVFVIYSKTEFKAAIFVLIKFAGYAILGTCMSAVILLPAVLGFLNSNRSESGYIYDLLYSVSDYESNFGGFLSVSTGGHDWTVMGYGAVVLIAVILLFMQKKHKDIKIAFLVLTCMTLLPTIGSLMNGFSYVSNRWIWGYSFLLAYIVVLKWRNLFLLSVREKRIMLICLSIYLVLCFVLVKSRTIDVMFAMAMVFLIFGVLCLSGSVYGIRCAQTLLIICILFNITGNAVFRFSQRNSGYVKEFLAYDGLLNSLKYTEAVAINKVDDTDEFFRYSGSSVTTNGTLYSGLHSTQYYWSLENGNITDYRNELGLSDSINSFNYKTLDSRTILSTLANVKYYVQGSNTPYGFSLIGSISNYSNIDQYLEKNVSGDYLEADLTEAEKQSVSSKITTYKVWENDYYLPFGYTYENYILAEDYAEMTPIEKQEAMLQGCVVDSDTPLGEAADVVFTGKSLDYEISAGSGVTVEDNLITVTTTNSTITLTFDGIENAETYLYITGLSYTGIEPVDRYTDLQWDLLSIYEQNEVYYSQKYYEDSTSLSITVSSNNTEGTSTSKTLTYYMPEYTWYSNREDFLINLGYDENSKVSITIKFPAIGEYSFDTLEVQCQPMENYPEQVATLAEDTMQDVDFHDDNAAFATNTVSGSISLDSSKYLLLTIPYTDGWTAYVDGEEVEILQANTMYMALYLEAGDHEIILTYSTPGLKVGLIISGLSLVTLMTFACFMQRKKGEKICQ